MLSSSSEFSGGRSVTFNELPLNGTISVVTHFGGVMRVFNASKSTIAIL
jgi:hypothetical protein